MIPTATISIDLDDVWAYRRAVGDPHWSSAPSIFPQVLPRLSGLRARTVFVCGRDLARPEGRHTVCTFMQMGLEIGDHSFAHDSTLPDRPLSQITADLETSKAAIACLTGKVPTGFRCPSFGTSPVLRQALRAGGYQYDASLLPTWIGPALRAWHRLTTRARAPRFASVCNGWRRQAPHRAADGLVNIPVTVMPYLRLPMHGSYLVALGPKHGRRYLARALDWCERSGLAPSFLIHPPDVADGCEAPLLSYLPGMRLDWQSKYDLIAYAVQAIEQRWPVSSLHDLAQHYRNHNIAEKS
jgi:peptidoglycan/xylan/chitin deacetylase (PgdA/CDA1 family)